MYTTKILNAGCCVERERRKTCKIWWWKSKAQEIPIWILFCSDKRAKDLEQKKRLIIYVGGAEGAGGKSDREANYWQKTFLDVDFPLNKFQNDVLKDRISIFVLSIRDLRNASHGDGKSVSPAVDTCWRPCSTLPAFEIISHYVLSTLVHISSSNKFRMLFDNHGVSLLCLQLILGKHPTHTRRLRLFLCQKLISNS